MQDLCHLRNPFFGSFKGTLIEPLAKLLWELGLGGTLGDIDPLNKAPVERAITRAKKGPLYEVSLINPKP